MSTADKLAEHVAGHIALQADRIRAELAAGLTSTRNAVRLQGARVQPVVPNANASTSPGRLVGWTLRETAGAAATVTVYDGRDATGDVVAVIPLAANAGANHWMGPGGVSVTEAAFVTVTGAVAGSLYLGAVD